MTISGTSRPEVRTRTGRYATASKALLRNSLLDSLHELLLDKDWSAIRVNDVAAATGVSRQTVYNEFGSRYGLAQAYAIRLASRFAGEIGEAIESHPDDSTAAFAAAFTRYFEGVASDPLIASLLAGEAKPDLLKLITTDAAPIITAASDQLVAVFEASSWLSLSDADAARIARTVTRMALSYVAMPPEGDRDVASDLAEVLGPAIEAARLR